MTPVVQVAGKVYQVHHIIPDTLWRRAKELRYIFKYVNDIPGVMLTVEEHALFTSRWAIEIAAHRGAWNAGTVMELAKRVYYDAPVYLNAAQLYILKYL